MNSNVWVLVWLRKTKVCNRSLEKLNYIDTDNFIVYIKANDIFKGIAKDVKTRFYTSNYELDKPLPQSN